MFSLTDYVRRLTVLQKFYLLIGVMLVILVLQVWSFSFVMSTMSSIRAFVGGEGLWSRAQKEAMVSLLTYSISHDEKDYQQSLSYLVVTSGDIVIQQELDKPVPNRAALDQGFIDGGSDPADFPGMEFVYRTFHDVSYMKQAGDLWRQGGVLVEKQTALGEEMHQVILAKGASTTQADLEPFLTPLKENDALMTTLEEEFSSVLGEGSRSMNSILFIAIVVLTTVFGLIAFAVALAKARLINRVDIAKSEFVALVSHQLRTPLTVVKLSAEALGKTDAAIGPEGSKAVENISHEVVQMAGLIDTILDVSRIELGTLTVNLKEADLVEAMKGTVAEARVAAGKKGMEIKESYEPSSILTQLDSGMLRIILQNLLSNAIKYSPQGSMIEVGAVKQQGRLLMSVRDHGYGIPKKQQKHIFTKMFRIQGAGRPDPGGTGLGLYIVKSIVEAIGGKVWFESVEGEGTVFYVSLPLSGMRKKSTRLS